MNTPAAVTIAAPINTCMAGTSPKIKRPNVTAQIMFDVRERIGGRQYDRQRLAGGARGSFFWAPCAWFFGHRRHSGIVPYKLVTTIAYELVTRVAKRTAIAMRRLSRVLRLISPAGPAKEVKLSARVRSRLC